MFGGTSAATTTASSSGFSFCQASGKYLREIFFLGCPPYLKHLQQVYIASGVKRKGGKTEEVLESL